MAKNDTFSLPGTGYEVLQKTVQAYYLARNDGPANTEQVGSRGGLSKTQVSRNNQFLVDIEVVTGGNKKEITPDGEKLAMAITNNAGQEEEANAWKDVFLTTQTVRELLEMIKVQGEVPQDDIAGRIASSLGVMVNEGRNKRRITRLVNLLERADLLEKEEGNYRIAPHALDEAKKPSSSSSSGSASKNGTPSSENDGTESSGETATSSPQARHVKAGETVQMQEPSLSVAVQVYVDADASPDQIDQVFASMAKHLYNRDDSE